MTKGKRKRVVCETGVDSDSGEERDIDVGILVNNHGHRRSSRQIHIERASSKHPNNTPLLQPAGTFSNSPSHLPPTQQTPTEEKRKQAGVIFFQRLLVMANKIVQGASVIMQAFEKHFDALQSAILEREHDLRTTADCACGQEPAFFRCEDCFSSPPSCRSCLLRNHCHLPFHHVQRWDSNHFARTNLAKLGLIIFLGHDTKRCPNAPYDSKGRLFTVVHTNGIHNINVNFCYCSSATNEPLQLTSAGLFPATVDKPETIFTFSMLKEFHAHTLASKKSAYNHFMALKNLTNNAFPDHTPVSSHSDVVELY